VLGLLEALFASFDWAPKSRSLRFPSQNQF